MRHLLILACLLLIVSSTSAQPIRYPLHIGDVWQYEDGVNWYIDRDTIMPNGEWYAVVTHNDPHFLSQWISYERQEDNKVFRYFTEKDTEYLWYDFSISIGEIVNAIPDSTDTTVIEFLGCWGDSIFGHYWPICGFFIYNPPLIWNTPVEVYRIADDIGVSSILTPERWTVVDLVGAIVDGIVYGTVTDINNFMEILPSSFNLSQNYPNPFNPSTQITFSVPKATNVTLKVYDGLGREIVTLVNERKQPGEYKVTWNAEGVPSGVYFYRIVAGEFTQTKKMVVIK